jgi:sigma-B regulation protein RsbU (phosphoserine phosphatase)
MLLLLALLASPELWIRGTLPHPLPPGAQLVFRAYMSDFEVFVDGQRVYEFHDASTRDRITIHVVPLRAGQNVYFRIANPRGLYIGGDPLIVARSELPAALRRIAVTPLREDMGDIAAGALLFILGLVALAISQLPRRGDTRVMLWFGLFAALYGLRILAESHLGYAVGMRGQLIVYATAWITYVITVPGWALARSLIGEGWKRTLTWQLYAFALFAPVAIAFDLYTGRAASAERANNVLVILGGLNIVFNLLHARQWKSLELRVVLIGALVFMLVAVANNLSGLGLLPGQDIDETLGFMVFVFALGFAATRSFLEGERARVALDNELATAREIQQSILPTSMPEVGRLRFQAHYDPASSVAGDLYDFLRVDEHRAGAIVADVSGHGVPAALIASMMKIAVSSQSPLAHQPAALLREVNRTLRGQVRRIFVTATYLYFDMERGCVEVANAGHPAPLLHRRGEVRELGPQGVVLGRFDAAYTAETVELERGDRIVAYTDGVTEALNARGEAFGEERLHALIRGGADADGIARAVREWRDAKSEADDVTLLMIDVLP